VDEKKTVEKAEGTEAWEGERSDLPTIVSRGRGGNIRSYLWVPKSWEKEGGDKSASKPGSFAH